MKGVYMTATAHALVAGAIATKVGNPATALTLSFLSHFIMDAVPHWDFGSDWRERTKLKTGLIAITDTLIGIGVTLMLFQKLTSPLLLLGCIFISQLPDWLEAPWYIFFAHKDKKEPKTKASFWEHLSFRIYKTENFMHRKTSKVFGIITQIVTVGFFFLLLQPF